MANHGLELLRASEYMYMQMIHVLASHLAGVDHCAKTVFESLFPRQLRDQGHHFAEYDSVIRCAIRKRRNVALGNNHEMYGGDRMDIVERQHVTVFKDLAPGNFAGNDFAENAVSHVSSSYSGVFFSVFFSVPRAAFSSSPDNPSRRASSSRISANLISLAASMTRQ